MTTAIDLNADVAESWYGQVVGDDAALVSHLTSANVACGYHAGDPVTLLRTLELCAAHNVVVGAQVSYDDREGFGRRRVDVDAAVLEAQVLHQIAGLAGLGRVAGAPVRYLKPHGALYHRVLTDADQARAVAVAVARWDPGMAVVTMSGALADVCAATGLRVVREGFADRAYASDGRLVPRDVPGAVLSAASEVAAAAVTLARSGSVDTLCLHGDTPGAAQLAQAVRAALAAAGITVTAFA